MWLIDARRSCREDPRSTKYNLDFSRQRTVISQVLYIYLCPLKQCSAKKATQTQLIAVCIYIGIWSTRDHYTAM